VTGAQPTPSAPAGRADGAPVDFAALARASGLGSVFRFGEIGAWQAGVEAVLSSRGPTLAVLDVAPVPGAKGPRSPGPAPARARAFMEALAGA